MRNPDLVNPGLEPDPVLSLRGQHNVLVRHRGTNAPETQQVRQELRSAQLERHIREVVDAAPALSAAQRDRLALLLRGAA